MGWIDDAIDKLLVKSPNELDSRLEQISFEIDITDTNAKGYCYCIKLDGNGNPRWEELVDYVAEQIVSYALPKNEIDAAYEYQTKYNNPSKTNALKTKAKELFTDLKKTGEGGEMLLYILIQHFLKLPQLISKMSLKTSGQLHYQGVDGIHVKYDDKTDALMLYWGESKMYKDVDQALRECFKSLKGYLLDAYSYNSTQERDLQLINSNLAANLNDPALENLLVRYFDKDDDLSNKLQYKGLCFVGFDCDKYPTKPLQKDLAAMKAEIEAGVDEWFKSTGKKIKSHTNLKDFEIHVFLIPFPSVQSFRTSFLKRIKNS